VFSSGPWRPASKRASATAHPRNGYNCLYEQQGVLEHAQTLTNDAPPRTTKLYDRCADEISLDEVEKIAI
jgi:hypothetical protein